MRFGKIVVSCCVDELFLLQMFKRNINPNVSNHDLRLALSHSIIYFHLVVSVRPLG